MQNPRYVVGLLICTFLFFYGMSKTRSSTSRDRAKHFEFEPRHHGHKMPISEKEQKETMAKAHHYSGLVRTDVNKNNVLSSVENSHGASKYTQRKLLKVGSTDRGDRRHGHHQKKNIANEDYYYTYDEDYETRASTASLKISNFLKEAKGWMIGDETDKQQEIHKSFLRGTSDTNHHN